MGAQLHKFHLFSILLIFISLLFIQSCREDSEYPNNPSDGDMQSLLKKTNSDIEQIARGLSIFLRQEKNQKLLETEIMLSKNVEQILEASKFLNNSRNLYLDDIKLTATSIGEAIANYLSENEKTSFINSIASLQFGLIDIYFPNVEHRKNWRSGDPLLVAYVLPRDKNDKSSIPAFDIRGNLIYLDYYKTPEIPTLVIYPSEKNKQYSQIDQNTFIQELSNSGYNIDSGTENPPPTPTYKFFIHSFLIGDDFDSGWFGGSMEIRFKYSLRSPTGSWSSWYTTNQINNVYQDTWINGYRYLFGSQFSNMILKFEVWEEDDWFNGANDLIADETYNYVYNRYGQQIGQNQVEFPWLQSISTDWSVEATDQGGDYDRIRLLYKLE